MTRQRPGDQPPPVPNDGPSMHDLVTEDLKRDFPQMPGLSLVVADLADRKALGLERYKSLLQTHNGRDGLRDLYEELQDGAVYAKRMIIEYTEAGLPVHALEIVYTNLLRSLLAVRGEIAAWRACGELAPGA